MNQIEEFIVSVMEFIKGCLLIIALIIMALFALLLGGLSLLGRLIWEFLEWVFTWCPYCKSHNLEKVEHEFWCRNCHRKLD